MPKKVFRNRIAWYMNQLGVSNADVLREAKISRGTLESLKKKGETRRIDADVVFELSEFFSLPVDRLFYVDMPSKKDDQ